MKLMVDISLEATVQVKFQFIFSVKTFAAAIADVSGNFIGVLFKMSGKTV